RGPGVDLGVRLLPLRADAARPDERLHRHPHLSGPREEARPRERGQLRRHSEDEAFGHDVQATAPGDVVATIRLVRAHEGAAEAELAGQRRGLRLARYPRVGATVEQE